MILELDNFSITQIADSGQCFRINKIDKKHWSVYHTDYKLIIKELGNNKFEFYCSQSEFNNIWAEYFDLNNNYSKFINFIKKSGDKYLINAANYSDGIRILKQDLFEVIISFIISQNNNITRIKNIIEKLSNFGKFPNIMDLSNYSVQDFKNIGTGYRAIYLYDIVQKIQSGEFNLELLKKLSYKNSIKYLMQNNGIGLKVANCITLFGLHHMQSFPQDVWINKIIAKHYNKNFNRNKYYDFAGLVQQYMFYYERNFCKNL